MLKRKNNLQLPVIQRVFLPLLEEFTQVVLDQQGASNDADYLFVLFPICFKKMMGHTLFNRWKLHVIPICLP